MKAIIAFIGRVVSFTGAPIKNAMLHNSNRVRVLILHNNELLLVKSSIGRQEWSLPGGGIEKNEDPEMAAVREVYEETSIEIHTSDLVRIGTERLPRSGAWPQVNMTFYQTTLVKKELPAIVRPLEILEAAWFPLNKLPKKYSETVSTALEKHKNN
jgi:8-oxo-dGTP pyrophosphatase MutT (NUDIX family)